MPGQNTLGKVWDNVTGGFVGITDKYWAAAVVPDQAQPFQGCFTRRDQGATKVYQANMLASARAVQPGATPRRRSASSRARRKWRWSTATRIPSASRTSTC